MSSSDSEDDCYGNIAQKLQSLKNKCVQDEVVFDDSFEEVANDDLPKDKVAKSTIKIATEDFNTSLNSTENDVLTLDDIIAANPSKKRGRKRKSAEPIYEVDKKPGRRKTANSNKNTDSSVDKNEVVTAESSLGSGKRGRLGRLRSEGTVEAEASPRGSRGKGRGRNRRTTGGNRGRNTVSVPAFSNPYPIFSIGNTDEYPDMSDNQQLFSTNTNSTDAVTIEDEDPLAMDNEELSVKVYWQSLEVVRFKIRKYQILTPVFKYFSEKENVGFEKLLFTYNEKIVKVDDSPDSINYSEAKFIDGGIVSQDVSGLIKQSSREMKGGLKLKFQCQNVKKPFETTVKLDDTLTIAMTKCAEHLEVSLDKLKFYFDGDLISRHLSPSELELEGGECIDVKIIT